MTHTLSISLADFCQTPRDYQLDVVEDALDWIGDLEPYHGGRRLYASPTGTGKGSVQLLLLKRLRAEGHDAMILTPSLEVIRGFLQRVGVPQEVIDESGPDKLAEMAEEIHVSTPTRHRNQIMRGERATADVYLYDEAHHAVEGNEVSGTLFAIAPTAAWIGMTATPYRGSPKATKNLRDAWGEPILVMDLAEAIDEGFLARPTFEVVPLVDDDKIKVVNGQFQASAATKATKSRVEALGDLIEETFGEESKTETPICVTVPSTEAAGLVMGDLERRGIGASLVVGTTPAAHRAEAYRLCEMGYNVLVSVKVLTEGIDLPWLEVLIDARPTASPVDFVQRLGRILRKKEHGRQPRYICTNRNLERFAFLLGGVMPRAAIKQAQEAFDAPTKRDGYRSIGFEALSRFKAIQLPLADGVVGTMFNVHSLAADGLKTEWVVLCAPHREEALVAKRETLVKVDEKTGERSYVNGRWQRASLPDDLTGFATSPQRGQLSKKQADWWNRAAARHGLDEHATDHLKRRQFAALPILSDLKEAL